MRIRPRLDPIRLAQILALAAFFFYLALMVARSGLGWVFPTANAQTAPPRVALPTVLEGMDRMTYVMPLDKGHQLCWSDGNTQRSELTARSAPLIVSGIVG